MHERVFAFLQQIRANTAPKDRNMFVYHQERGVTPIWYRKEHDGVWHWTPDLQVWMPTPQMTVTSGIWAGGQPAMCNKIIICALAKSDAAQQHWLPLHVAAQHRFLSVCTAILKAGVSVEDLNRVDADGRSALWIAASLGHAPIVLHLLAESQLDVGLADVSGQTPLHAAVIGQHVVCVRLLLAHCGRRLRDALLAALPVCVALRELPALLLIAILDELGTAVSELTMHQKWTFVTAVKHGGAGAKLDEARDVALPDALGRTPLWWAVHSQNIELVELVLNATPPSVADKPDKSGVAPRDLVQNCGRTDIARLFAIEL
jgi:hypothetical protein